MIQKKHIILFVSAGRTGTKFFSKVLRNMIHNCYTVHEPDVIAQKNYSRLIWQIHTFGLYQVVIGKIMNSTGMRNISRNYIKKKLSKEKAITLILQHRQSFYNGIYNDPIIETNLGWYGLLPLLPDVFNFYKTVVIIRDPRTWVTSIENWGTIYGARDWKLGRDRTGLSPYTIKDKEYLKKWDTMSVFEKLCWRWKTMYEHMLNAANKDKNILVIRFEDLFTNKGDNKHFKKILKFVTHFEDKNFHYRFSLDLVKNKINASKYTKDSHWSNWPSPKCQALTAICGEIMKEYDYGTEERWIAKIKS